MVHLYQNLWQKMDQIKWFIKWHYSVNKIIRFKTSILISDVFDYSDVYIVVKGRISVTGTNNANKRNKKLTFKNNAPFAYQI